ncbi:MAG: tRNA threonylcarbamoyladenosine dehydratase [Muribaculaceae bacterium]|nr:tRNA threonylcarbamoyladenosine dehydratase [Muribaculaceae bacterium]
MEEKEILNRAGLLLGTEGMRRLSEVRIIIFGVGGVGSWCAESLVRTGVKHLTIVDSDDVSVSNINRQLMATTKTVGESKVEALRRHLLDILPDAEIITRHENYTKEREGEFNLEDYDVIIDAIDSLKDKATLIENATRCSGRFYSSMGAALKCDPTRVRVAEFWQVKGCPLARALRNRFKKSGIFPGRKFKCVYSEELLSNEGQEWLDNVDNSHDLDRKASINGSLMHITAIFGLMLAGLAISEIVKR